MTNNQTDFRALCAELLEIIDFLCEGDARPDCDIVTRVRAALAQPEPEQLPQGYIDPEHKDQERELLEVFYRACRSEGGTADEIHLRGIKAVLANAPLVQPEPEGPTDEEIADEARKYLVNEYALPAEITHLLDSDIFEYEPTIGCFRAVLARWGSQPIEPVPVNERLPGPEDCDAEGRCWYFFMDSVIGGCGWQMFNEEENQQLEASHFWLPHYALPVPTLNNEENK